MADRAMASRPFVRIKPRMTRASTAMDCITSTSYGDGLLADDRSRESRLRSFERQGSRRSEPRPPVEIREFARKADKIAPRRSFECRCPACAIRRRTHLTTIRCERSPPAKTLGVLRDETTLCWRDLDTRDESTTCHLVGANRPSVHGNRTGIQSRSRRSRLSARPGNPAIAGRCAHPRSAARARRGSHREPTRVPPSGSKPATTTKARRR